jgi:two-component system, OmpR family, sensor histidine kinase MprB
MGAVAALGSLVRGVSHQRGVSGRLKRHTKQVTQRHGPTADEVFSLTLGLLTHDLRSPLLSSRRTLDQLRGGKDDAEAELLEAVCAALEHIEGMVGRLLGVERLESSTLAPHVAVDQVAREAAEVCSAPDQIDVLTVSSTAMGDAVLLRACIGNLLENALRYARDQVLLRAGPVDGGSLVMVDDDGPGIDPPLRDLIFQPLVRLEPEAGPGAGLGLSLVRRTTELHGGRVWAEASPSGGARFCLWLPGPG